MAKIPKQKKNFWQEPAKTVTTKKSNHQEFYNSSVWKKVRAKQIAKQPMCEICLYSNIEVPADQVDHIISISWGGSKLNMENLQSLCYKCHGAKSRIEQDCYKKGIIYHFTRGSLS